MLKNLLDTSDYTHIMMDVDKNKDGQISVDEAKEVKGLNLEGVNLGDSYNICIRTTKSSSGNLWRMLLMQHRR